jgi:phosphoribosylanthranilate isomerase
MPTQVKICGITNLADAELAAGHGAWAVGTVFAADSPRRCEPDVAAEIATALKRRTEVVGVFVNAALDELVATADTVGLTMLQLHGDEGPSYCAEARRRSGLPVIKAVRVRDAASVRGLAAYKTDFHLLDAHSERGRGGTGETFDWSLAAMHPGKPPVLLSGGLTPGNVQEAVATVRPFAVDVASGVEASPGRKDPELLSRFFDAVRAAAPATV